MHTSASGLKMAYGIDDTPPIHLCLFLGLQQFLTMIGGTMATPLMVSEATCVGQDLVGRAEILGSLMFVVGWCTLLQTLVGARLPIIQGASFTFIAPILAMQSMDEFKCPPVYSPNNLPENGTNNNASSYIIIGSDEHRAIWMSRLVEIQGAMMVAGAFQAVLGILGVIGVLLQSIGPLTIAPTIGLLGLSFGDEIVSHYAAKYWPVAILSLVLVIIFSLYLNNVPVPFPATIINRSPIPNRHQSKRKFSCGIIWFRMFGLFPVLLSIVISWALCAILTAANVFPNSPSGYGYEARTDTRLEELSVAAWIRFPYPGQWGRPRLTLSVALGMIAGIIGTMMETIGDFYAWARLCGIPSPPAHAINRGMFIEGIGCALAGVFGCGPGITAYAVNIGAIAITRVASRRVFYFTACYLIVFGCVTKIAAVFVLIPDPILGGVLIGMLAMIAAVGFSNLQFLDLNSTRNLLIFGLSMFLGLAIPSWVKKNQAIIKTGSDIADQALVVLLSTAMLVGGFTGFFLDNTVPGATREQRGMGAFSGHGSTKDDDKQVNNNEASGDHYDLPIIGRWIKKCACLRYLPISPNFEPSLYGHRCCGHKSTKHVKRKRKTSIAVINPDTEDIETRSIEEL